MNCYRTTCGIGPRHKPPSTATRSRLSRYELPHRVGGHRLGRCLVRALELPVLPAEPERPLSMPVSSSACSFYCSGQARLPPPPQPASRANAASRRSLRTAYYTRAGPTSIAPGYGYGRRRARCEDPHPAPRSRCSGRKRYGLACDCRRYVSNISRTIGAAICEPWPAFSATATTATLACSNGA